MNAIYGLFSDASSARKALNALHGAGARMRIGDDQIIVMSSEPPEDLGLDLPRQRTRMPWLAALGGIFGGTAGYSLVTFTQRTYPLPTGNMPIIALWPTGVVTYEFTMLGAILMTALTFFITTRLPRSRRRFYDPEVSRGKILIGVADSDSNFWRDLERTLYEQGAEQVKQYSHA
jgi:hypothetical protein